MAIHHFLEAMTSGFEGREEELGKSISTVLKTLKNVKPYPHEINDGLIKAWLVSIQPAVSQLFDPIAGVSTRVDAQATTPDTLRRLPDVGIDATEFRGNDRKCGDVFGADTY